MKLFSRRLPRECRAAPGADSAIQRQRVADGNGQILMEDSGYSLLDDIDGPGNREGGDRDTARPCLDHGQPERVGETGKHKDVRGRQHPHQLGPEPVTGEHGPRKARRERFALRAIADDDLRAGDIEP